MKKRILFGLIVIVLMISTFTIRAQVLPSNFFSQNGWMPDSLGRQDNTVDSAHCPGLKVGYNIPCYLNGSLYQHLGDVQASEVRYIRFGGISVDQNNPKPYQYLKFVDSVRARGMEPILQIPLNLAEVGASPSLAYDTINAKNLIIYINQTYARNVTLWSIGNEPDNKLPKGYGYDTTTKVFLITTYIKNYSKAMRRAVPSVPIKIMGPELADWNSDRFYKKKKMVDSLLGPTYRCDITGFDPVTGKPWIDYFSFHLYGGVNGDAASLSRATLIDKLRATKGLAETLDTLNFKLAAANTAHGRTGASILKSSITEAHIDVQSISSDAFSDVKCNGFFAGQFWSEIASIATEKGVDFVSYWSSVENAMGYMKDDGTKKSTYCHFQKIAENFSGNYYTASDKNGSGANIKNVKAFGTKDASHIAIVIMNQDSLPTGTPPKRAYAIRLDGTYPTTSDTNKITINMGVNRTYYDTIESASTTLLIFDLLGNISQKYSYKQSLGTGGACFHQTTCGSSVTYATQLQLDGYLPSTYSNIIIGSGTGSNWITLSPTDNSIYRAVNNITLKGNFKVPPGQSFSLIPTPCN